MTCSVLNSTSPLIAAFPCRLKDYDHTTLSVAILRPGDGSNEHAMQYEDVKEIESHTRLHQGYDDSDQVGLKRRLTPQSAPSRRSKRLRVLASSRSPNLTIPVTRTDTVMEVKQKVCMRMF